MYQLSFTIVVLQRTTSSIHERICTFHNLPQNFDTATGWYYITYPKKLAYIRRSLSLSPPPPMRERGEVRGSCTSTIASNHRLPFLANVPLTAYRPPCAMPFSGVFIWNITLVSYILTSNRSPIHHFKRLASNPASDPTAVTHLYI